MPRKTFLNCTMPAFVNSNVGSSAGTSDELGRTAWPLRSKYARKRDRISEACIGAIYRRSGTLGSSVVGLWREHDAHHARDVVVVVAAPREERVEPAPLRLVIDLRE